MRLGTANVIAFLCCTTVSFRPSSRPRSNNAISLGQHLFYSGGGPLLTVAYLGQMSTSFRNVDHTRVRSSRR